MRPAVLIRVIAIAASLAGCATTPHPPQLVVLVPDRQGKVGTVVVKEVDGGSTTLNEAYTAARVDTAGGKFERRAVTASDVKAEFAHAIAAQPIRPVSFLLYFQEGTDEFTPASRAAFKKVLAEVARRKAAEITVIGHTDTVGKVEFNDMLSLKRAERVRKHFSDRGIGIPAHLISTAGRGERELLVQTGDEVPEPRNRRVEISVR